MGPFIFLDTETTGMNPSIDRMIEVAMVKWQSGKILDQFESLIDPGVPIPYEIKLLTGISDEDTKSAPRFREIQNRVSAFIGDAPIIGHNIAFDTGFLNSHHLHLKNPEIDTLALARILLRKEASYALEVLMKKYRLAARNSHRAMADVLTTMAFFEFLLEKIAEIPEDVHVLLEHVLKKSAWAGKELFGNNAKGILKRVQDDSEGAGAPAAHTGTSQPALEWPSSVTQDFLSGQKIILESGKLPPFKKLCAQLPKKPLVVAYNSPRMRDRVIAHAKASGLKIMHLKEPPWYLSPQKLKRELSAPEIKAEITPFLLKMILWNVETVTGDREEISLEREEYGLFELIADSGGTDIFWQRAAAKISESDIVLLHQYAFANGLAEKITVSESPPNDELSSASALIVKSQPQPGKQVRNDNGLIVLEASQLEESFTIASGKKFTESGLRPFFGEKATILFGLLGIFYEHFVQIDDIGNRGDVTLNETARASTEWQRVLDVAQNLPAHTKKDELLTALAKAENTISWVSSFTNEIAFNCAPILLATLFQEQVAPYVGIVLQSACISANGSFNLIQKLFGLDMSWQQINEVQSDQNLDIKIPTDFPEPYSEGYFRRCLNLFTEIINEKKGKSLFLMSSKKAAAAMYSALLPKAEAAGIKLLGVGLSGGTGKSLALFLENPDSTVLLATRQILPSLPEIEAELDTVVFQKIPFDPPGNPILSLRSQKFENSFEEYTLPRAVIKFRELLAELGASGAFRPAGTAKICYLLDSRLRTRDYGKLFIN